jgi:hypothetical protein
MLYLGNTSAHALVRLTGERGDRILLDDPHNVIKAESDTEREKTVRFVRESMTRKKRAADWDQRVHGLRRLVVQAFRRRDLGVAGAAFQRRKARGAPCGHASQRPRAHVRELVPEGRWHDGGGAGRCAPGCLGRAAAERFTGDHASAPRSS